MATDKKKQLLQRRKTRNRNKIRLLSKRMRLSVFRSNLHIYAQIIDDANGKTVTSASTLERDFIVGNVKQNPLEKATSIGNLIASRATSLGVFNVVFDRGSYLYHGRVKALAEGARQSGLSF